MSVPLHSTKGRNSNGGYCSFSYSGNSLERFEESLSRLNLPRWMNRKAEVCRGTQNGESEENPSPAPSQFGSSKLPSQSSSRLRYSEYKRSSSVQRDPSYYWRRVDLDVPSNQNSREPSPVTIWPRPPTAPACELTSRCSGSTMSDSVYSGQVTPTESMVSGQSCYYSHKHSGFMANHKLSAASSLRKPYTGWRSQENISDCHKMHCNTPSQRLAYSLRKSKQTGSLSSIVAEDSSRHRKSHKKEFDAPASDWYIQDSIKSVSSAIAEFCNADDVPVLPPTQEELLAKKHRSRGRCRDHNEPKPKIVWLESSFVSAKTNSEKVARKD